MKRFLLLCAVALLWIPMGVSAFGVSPASLDFLGQRGQTLSETFTVINPGAAEQTYYLGTLKFVPSDTSGIPSFVPYDTDHSGLAEWIRFPHEAVVVPGNSSAEVPFEIAIPSDIESGSYYAAATVSATPSEIVAANGASVSAKTAVLIFLTVEGETNRVAVLSGFVSPDAPGLLVAHSVSYAAQVQNQGNVTVVPNASIVVTDVLGRVVFTKAVNEEKGRVLPGTTRTFYGELAPWPASFLDAVRQEWSLFAVGPVKATFVMDGTDPADGPAIHYWMFPWQLLVCGTTVLLVPLLILYGLFRRKRNV